MQRQKLCVPFNQSQVCFLPWRDLFKKNMNGMDVKEQYACTKVMPLSVKMMQMREIQTLNQVLKDRQQYFSA